MVGYSLQASKNPFRGQTQPAGRMLPMPAVEQATKHEVKQSKIEQFFGAAAAEGQQ